MLKLSPRQMGALDDGREHLFRKGLVERLRQTHESCAPLHPMVVYRLLGLALRRARGYGFTFEKTLAEFVSLMAGMAPNFDAHPAVHALLTAPGTAVEARVGLLVERLPAGVWAEVAEHASTVGWFLTEDGFTATVPQRIAMALPNALPQGAAGPADTLEARVIASIERARPLGFYIEDQQFVHAACEVIYGNDFASAKPWAAQALDRQLPAPIRTSLLRTRIAIDTGAWL